MKFTFNCPLCEEKLYLNGCHNTDCEFEYFNWQAVTDKRNKDIEEALEELEV